MVTHKIPDEYGSMGNSDAKIGADTGKDLSLFEASVLAQEDFRRGIWYTIADGEMENLTRREMAMVLHEVADELEPTTYGTNASN